LLISGGESLTTSDRYLDNNCISAVTGLESFHSLLGLHISSQRVDPDHALQFHPVSLRSISVCTPA
jgi:hypothetical protein